MYYITKVTKNSVSVMDTADNVEDKLTPIEVLQAERMGYKVKGLIHLNGQVYFYPYTVDLIKVDSLAVGTPVRIKLSKGLGFKQTLYAGKQFKNGKLVYYFYDDSGVDGYFGLSSEYIAENSISFDFSNNDAVRVATLVHRFKDLGGI